ncbi:MAG: arsenate reductase ArsC [Oligoflexales bacterium]
MLRILFLCVANSARSQMAEGIAKQLFNDDKSTKIYSAGTQPSTIHPCAIEVLSEIGINAQEQHSKSVNEFMEVEVDWVITLCQEESCPVLQGPAKKLHWPMPDPVEPDSSIEQIQLNFRQVRDMIKIKLEQFKSELSVD